MVLVLPWATNSPAIGAGLGLNRPVNYAPKTKNVIYLYMSGGMSHLDTFDPKTSGAGPMEQVKTKTDGIVLAETLPLLANHSDKIAVIRGLTSTKGAHEQGNYFMHTSYDKGNDRAPQHGLLAYKAGWSVQPYPTWCRGSWNR